MIALNKSGVKPSEMQSTVSWYKKAFCVLEGILSSNEVNKELTRRHQVDGPAFRLGNWFTDEEELMHLDDRTLLVSKQWGKRTERALIELTEAFPASGVTFTRSQ